MFSLGGGGGGSGAGDDANHQVSDIMIWYNIQHTPDARLPTPKQFIHCCFQSRSTGNQTP